MAELLVSVRSVAEAAAALAGGAAIIDVKEPAHGSLGRADNQVIADIIAFVAGRLPVSAAMGELLQEEHGFSGPGLSFVKWGLAGCGRAPSWLSMLETRRAASASELGLAQVVFVAYADWQCSQAPPVEEVVALACRTSGSTLLLDTGCKDRAPLLAGRRATLLDWLPLDDIGNICAQCRHAKVRVALAGSLGCDEICRLRPVEPAWFAVRGAACTSGQRDGIIQECRVRQLVNLLRP